MTDRFRLLSVCAALSTFAYLLWLSFHVPTASGKLFFCLETAMGALIFLFAINHWQRRYVMSGGAYALSPEESADVFILTKNEPVQMLRDTVHAAMEIHFPYKEVYVLDDGGRPEVERLAASYGCRYVARDDRTDPARQFKAANLNYGLSVSSSAYVLALDADQIPKPSILDELVGHFKDPKVGLVTTRQRFDVPKGDFNHDHLFYEYMQSGKNAHGVAISCGSGVIYRRAALQAIGGFQEWNLVEDLYTTYVMNAAGYSSVYTNQSYTMGTAPQDLRTICKQRYTWALDTLRFMLWKFGPFETRLTVRQRLHYAEIGYIYLVSALAVPGIYLLTMYSLVSGATLATGGIFYLVFKLPCLFLTLKAYDSLGTGKSSSRMWAALFPVFFAALIGAILYEKPAYKVTEKGKKPKGRAFWLAAPQLFFAIIGLFSVAYAFLAHGLTALLWVNSFWIALMLYWTWPAISLALSGSRKA